MTIMSRVKARIHEFDRAADRAVVPMRYQLARLLQYLLVYALLGVLAEIAFEIVSYRPPELVHTLAVLGPSVFLSVKLIRPTDRLVHRITVRRARARDLRVLERPPAYRLLRVIEFFVSSTTYSHVFQTLLADYLKDWTDAVAEGRTWQARLIKHVKVPLAVLVQAGRLSPLGRIVEFVKGLFSIT